ncbi:MAG: 3-deoxy-D-manno-octulosonic acid transferase [Pseudomonadota bacterium]
MQMNPFYLAYNCIGTGLFLALFPPFWLYSRITGRYRNGMGQRLGYYPGISQFFASGSPRIWLHAVSVGEVSVAVTIMNALVDLIPSCQFILSTTTEHAQKLAQDKLQSGDLYSKTICVFAPIDMILSARKALRTLNPDVLACIETEIWPNWIMEASRMGIKTALLNGRISVRSIKGYLKILPLMKQTLKHVDAFSMIRDEDARRIRDMGAHSDRIEINGNAKYDLLLQQADPASKYRLAELYNLKGGERVFIAGSTRGEEEKMILDAYEKILRPFPETLLIIAPRHIERAGYIADLVKNKGFSFQFRTDFGAKDSFRNAPVIIVDTIGELQRAYSIGTIVFCGGSLVPTGGQNVLEAAAWGKPVLYGPSMEDFLDAKEFLDQTGGGIEVRNGQDLTEKIIHLLGHPEEAERIGNLARQAVMQNRGAAGKHAEVIRRLLQQP